MAPRQEAEPATTDVTEVAPGILRLQLPITMPGLRHVNCYALEDERGVAIVDPGMPGPRSWRQLVGRLAQAGFSVRDVHTVVVTHSHVDHFGAAGKVRVDAHADVVTSSSFRTWWDPTDVDEELVDSTGAGSTPPPQPFWKQEIPWGGRNPRRRLRVRWRYQIVRPVLRRWFATPEPSVRLADADVVKLGRREWVSLHTPGHTPDHLCLYDPDGGVLLSGDHVLPTITPHISGIDTGPDPLRAFFGSLDKVAALPHLSTVLPAHGQPFSDLAGRAAAIRRHHEERLVRLRESLGTLGQATVEDASRQLFKPRSWGPMADSETYAHLEHLRLGGEVVRRDRDGRLWYSLAS
jgi:glyoxylase-like metal-dependent hydrolase (beta-lactamase superfamily II)